MNLLQEIRRTLCSWLLDDRIRTSPRDGRLLNLDVGDQLLLERRLLIVRKKCRRGNRVLEYGVEEDGKDFCLQVSVNNQLAILMSSQRDSVEMIDVFPEDVTVLPNRADVPLHK